MFSGAPAQPSLCALTGCRKKAFLPFFNLPRRGTRPRRAVQIKRLASLICVQPIHDLLWQDIFQHPAKADY